MVTNGQQANLPSPLVECRHPKAKILVVDLGAQDKLRTDLRRVLHEASESHSIEPVFHTARNAAFTVVQRIYRENFAKVAPQLVLLLTHDSSESGLIALLREESEPCPVIVVLSRAQPREIEKLLDAGANDYLLAPLSKGSVLPRLRLMLQCSEAKWRSNNQRGCAVHGLLGQSPALLTEITKIPAIARSPAPVLICGETGTGKELCARAIHYLSRRSGKPFVPCNCGAIPCDLMENEMFGHEAGAYTGARTAAVGFIERAAGGLLFLDELDTMPLLAQVKLLRFLQDGEFQRLGSQEVRKADVRVVAATNYNPVQALQEGRLRQDLYFRLNVLTLKLPPLRERLGDLPLLARHFLKQFASVIGKPMQGLTNRALDKLGAYAWPGNVRELENIITRAVTLCEQQIVDVDHIDLPQAVSSRAFQESKAEVIAAFEKRYLTDLLAFTGGNLSRAARMAKKDRRALWYLLRKHGLSPH